MIFFFLILIFMISRTLKKSILFKKNWAITEITMRWVSRWVTYAETSIESTEDGDANAWIRNMTTFHRRWKFSKARKLSYSELHYSFSSEYHKYSGGDTSALILSLFLSISLYLSSIVNPTRTRGFPYAHIPKGHSREIMNETSIGKRERPNVFHVHPSVIFSYIMPIIEGCEL